MRKCGVTVQRFCMLTYFIINVWLVKYYWAIRIIQSCNSLGLYKAGAKIYSYSIKVYLCRWESHPRRMAGKMKVYSF